MIAIPFVSDANILASAPLRDTLLRLAEVGLLRPYWSDGILHEVDRTLRVKLGVPPEKVAGTMRAIRETFPDACVTVDPARVAALLNHPKDRHVAAVAVEAGVERIVTLDRRGFHPLPEGITAIRPDALLLEVFEAHADLVIDVLHQQAAFLTRPPLTTEQILDKLGLHVPRFVEAVRARLARERRRRR